MPFLEDVKAELAEDVNYTDGISTVPLTQSVDWVKEHFSEHGGYARLDDDKDWVIGQYDTIKDGALKDFTPIQAGLTVSASRHKFPAGTLVVPINVDLYDPDVIPESYIKFDEHDDLKGLLGALSKQLSKVRSLSDVLTTIQDPDRCPPRFLDLIAESFGWELKSETVKGKRIEARNIIEYYRLKGTEEGIKILASPILGDYFSLLKDTDDYDFSWQMRGNWFYFNGDRSRVAVKHADELDLQPPFRFEWWMKPELARKSFIFGKGGSYQTQSGYGAWINPDFVGEIKEEDVDDYIPLVFAVGHEDGRTIVKTPLSLRSWGKITVTVEEDEINLHVNDRLRDRTGLDRAIHYEDDSSKLWFGADQGRRALYQGYLDEIKFWSGLQRKQSKLVGYWRLDEVLERGN